MYKHIAEKFQIFVDSKPLEEHLSDKRKFFNDVCLQVCNYQPSKTSSKELGQKSLLESYIKQGCYQGNFQVIYVPNLYGNIMLSNSLSYIWDDFNVEIKQLFELCVKHRREYFIPNTDSYILNKMWGNLVYGMLLSGIKRNDVVLRSQNLMHQLIDNINLNGSEVLHVDVDQLIVQNLNVNVLNLFKHQYGYDVCVDGPIWTNFEYYNPKCYRLSNNTSDKIQGKVLYKE